MTSYRGFGDRDKRRPLKRNQPHQDTTNMKMDQVMESFYTFIKYNGLDGAPIQVQADKFCKKYNRVAEYKDLIIQKALLRAEDEE